MKRWIAVVVTAVGCSGGGGDDGTDAGALEVVLDPCGFPAATAATIDVSERFDLFHAGAFAKVGAAVRQSPEPSLHEVVLEEGECRYLRAALGFCDPPCGGAEQCTTDGECRPYPLLVSGGTLTLTGLGDTIEIEPEDFSPGTYVGPGGLPADLFDAEDVVGARLTGGDFPATSLAARGVASIDAGLTGSGVELLGGQDAEISWTPGPDPEACVQVVLNGFNQTHGAPLSDLIRCEGADDGSLVVPQALVEEFPIGEQPEVTESYDWPHSELTRYTRSTRVTGQGPAALVVRSTTYFLIRHPR
jgi:hypothetical protein